MIKDETERTEVEYTWFDVDSVNIETRLQIVNNESYTRNLLQTYNKSGEIVESNYSYQSKDSEYFSTLLVTANFDSMGKVVSYFQKGNKVDMDEIKPQSKTIVEFEYYD